MTGRFESAYDTIAEFIGAPGRESIALYRNATEAINAVMYSLLTEFRDGDNVVTTMLEHNSNYVPWHALAREILPRFGRRVECRLARFDPVSGELLVIQIKYSAHSLMPACSRHTVHSLVTAESRPQKRINRNEPKAHHRHDKSARQIGHVGNSSHHFWQNRPAHDGHDKKGGCLFCPLPEAENAQRKDGREHDGHKKISQ